MKDLKEKLNLIYKVDSIMKIRYNKARFEDPYIRTVMSALREYEHSINEELEKVRLGINDNTNVRLLSDYKDDYYSREDVFEINIKSGDSGYDDYDGCDLCMAKIPSNNIPRVGDKLSFDNQDYLVKDVVRHYWDIKSNFKERVVVYVFRI